jgi:hypothetical protein
MAGQGFTQCTRCLRMIDVDRQSRIFGAHAVAPLVLMPVGEELSFHMGRCKNHVGVDIMGHWESHVQMAETHLPLLDDVLPPDLCDLVLGYLFMDYCVEWAEGSRSRTTFNDLFDTERYIVAEEALVVVLWLNGLHTDNYPLYVKKMDPRPPGIIRLHGGSEYVELGLYMICAESIRNYRRERDTAYRGINSRNFAQLMGHVVGYERHYPSRQAVLDLWSNHFQMVLENELSTPYVENHPQYGRIYVLQQINVPWYVQLLVQMYGPLF